MAEAIRVVRVSVEDYLAAERHSPVRHEYVDGELFAVAGAGRAHNALAVNLTRHLANHLDGGPCRIAASDMKVRPADATRFYYPDLVVSCNDPADEPDDHVETHPTLVAEILSTSTRETDRREKRFVYQSIETLREYVLLEQDAREIVVYRRDGDGWLRLTFGAGDRVAFDSLGFEIDVDALYRGVV